MGAAEARILESHHLFIGEDWTITIDVTQSDGSTPQTMTGWGLTWEFLSKRGGTVLISKTVGSGIGIGNGAGTNDRATITVADDTNESALATSGPATYFHVLRRTDAGSEKVLAFGDAVVQRASI